MARHAILGVEGPHDLAFVAKILTQLGLPRFDGTATSLDPFWKPLVPSYPKNGKLYERMDMPTIVANSEISVAVYCAGGTNLREKFPATFTANPQYKTDITAFGILADSDVESPQQVASQYAMAYQPHFPAFPNMPGRVDQAVIKTGIFVFPNGADKGTLEIVLLECADRVYPQLKRGAESFVAGIDQKALTNRDLEEINAPAGLKKAVVGGISNILKPGKTTQVSIQDNRWICQETLALPSVTNVVQFLKTILTI